MSHVEPTPSFIQNLLRGKGRQQNADADADRELDEALSRLASALNNHETAVAAVRRRQSSGSLKLLSLPEPAVE